MSNTLRERLEELCLLATQGGDPIREPRRSHIARYYCALSEAWLKGDLVPAPAVPDDVAKMLRALRFYSEEDAWPLRIAAADALEAQAAELARLQSRLRMIVSHATMGSATGEGQSTNDICVQITALRNDLYQAGKDAHTAAQPSPDAVAEAARDVMAAWRKSSPMMTADYHGDNCDCLRCAMGDLEHAIAKGSRP